MRYRMEVVGVDGEPTAPDDVAKKFVKQCGVLVRDYIPIIVQEWNRPSSGGVPYVGDVAKDKLTTRKTLIHGPIICGALCFGAPQISICGAPYIGAPQISSYQWRTMEGMRHG
jgi:hypothetical protein